LHAQRAKQTYIDIGTSNFIGEVNRKYLSRAADNISQTFVLLERNISAYLRDLQGNF